MEQVLFLEQHALPAILSNLLLIRRWRSLLALQVRLVRQALPAQLAQRVLHQLLRAQLVRPDRRALHQLKLARLAQQVQLEAQD